MTIKTQMQTKQINIINTVVGDMCSSYNLDTAFKICTVV